MTIQLCRWCGNDTQHATAAAIEHSNSGPGRILYACPGCMSLRRIIPLDQHPADSWGAPRYGTPRPPYQGGRCPTALAWVASAERPPERRSPDVSARHDDDYAAALPDGLRHTALHGEGEAVTTGTYPVVDVQEGWDLASMLAVEAPGTVTGYRADGDERTTWLAHPDGSWARATSYGGQLPLVHQSGPRRLWDVLDRIRSYWLQHGELPLRGARVQITPDGHTVLARGSWRATL